MAADDARDGEDDVPDATARDRDDDDDDDDGDDDDGVLLTPGTYATSVSAERRVEEAIASSASDAYVTTDFDDEPHLCPELEDAEAAAESRLDAEAAHMLAEAAEKESRQVRAAAEEREREMEWMENHRGSDDARGEEEEGEGGGEGSSSLTSTLYAAQLAGESRARVRAREAFHRSMLSARIANDDADRRRRRRRRRKGVGGGAPPPAREFESGGRGRRRRAEEGRRGDGDGDPPAAAAVAPAPFFAMIETASTAAERAPLLGWGIPAPSSSSIRSSREEEEEEEESPIAERVSEDPIVREDPRGGGRDRYVREIWNGVHEKAIERTRLRMSLRNGGGGVVVVDGDAARGRGVAVFDDGADGASDEDDDDGEYHVGGDDGEYHVGGDDGRDVAAFLRVVDDAAAIPTEEGGGESSHYSGSGGAVERRGTRRRGFVRRVRRKRRRSFLVVALAVVVGRRLMLAYFGNALRLM